MKNSVVIVNYNGARWLRDCLEGLEAQTRAPYEVVVVDNGSTDDSADFIRSNFPWVKLVEAGSNLGFAAGTNLGIDHTGGDVLILLNNDTVPSPGFIEALIRPLEANESISAVSGVMLFAHQPEVVATSGIEVYDNGLALDRDLGETWRRLPGSVPIFGPTGGAMAIRRSAFDDVERFPEPYFMYLEDVDLAWRLRLRGNQSVSCAAAWVHHIYSASAGESSPFKDFHLARNRAWTIIRCWPRELWGRHWAKVLLYEIGALGYGILSRRWSLIAGRYAGWSSFRRLSRPRSYIQRRRTSRTDELLYWMRSAPSVRNTLYVRSVIQSLTGRRARRSDGD